MTILDAITSSPLNVFFTIVIGIGLAFLYYRKPPSSSSSSSSSSSTLGLHSHHPSRAFSNHTNRSSIGVGGGPGVVDEELQRAIAEIERQERDMIRQEQDAAYQQSLKADREKRLKKEEELKDKEVKEKAERERLAQLEQLHDRLMKLRCEITDKLPPKPSQDNTDIVKLVFKLPDGTRVKRDFCKSDKVKYLYWFVFSLENAPLQFKLTTNFPKRDLPGRPPKTEDFQESSTNPSSTEPNCEQTLLEAGIVETQIIFVYDLEA